MGADYKGQEKAIAELSAMSPEAKAFLNHHIGNSLGVVVTSIEATMIDILRSAIDDVDINPLKAAKAAAFHIVDDLHLAGIRTIRR